MMRNSSGAFRLVLPVATTTQLSKTIVYQSKRAMIMVAGTVAMALSFSSAAHPQQAQQASQAQQVGIGILPGDTGKPPANWGLGIPPLDPNFQAPKGFKEQPLARGPGIELALKAAKAIATQCKQYPLGIAVVNSAGYPILVYIPDGSLSFHSYTAIRKAYSAVVFKTLTSQMGKKAQQDAEFAAKVASDPNLIVFPGGIPLKVGDEIIGAIGVGGAEPGGHDEECGLKGLAAIKDELK